MEIIEEECESEKENIDVDESSCRIEETRPPATTSIGVQTDLCMEDIEELQTFKRSQESKNAVLSEPWFEADDERVKFYTSLTAMSVLMAVFELISPALPEQKCVPKFQQLIMTIMRLRLNLSVQDLAYRFGIHASTVSRVFQSCVHTMFASMTFLVRWPEREELRLTLPACFKEKFSSCAVIISSQLLTASKFLLTGLHACLLVPRRGLHINIIILQSFLLELPPKELCHLFPRVGEGAHQTSS